MNFVLRIGPPLTDRVGMLTDSDLRKLRRFVQAQRRLETTPFDRLWAGRCAALLEELERLEQEVEGLSRDVDAVVGSNAGDTWVM